MTSLLSRFATSMCRWTLLVLLLTTITQSSGRNPFLASPHNDCTSRFEYRNEMREHFPGCTEVRRANPMCRRNYTVAYGEHPPYVYLDKNGEVEGILPDMLRFSLDICCFGCNYMLFDGPYDHLERLFQDADLVVPIQTSITSEEYFGTDYVHMVEVKTVAFFGPPIEHDPHKMGEVIVGAALSTWPLFVIAFSMALTSGVCVWLLDSKWNKSEFPSTFPRGPFEGFWWAFVSMTTVGYGDRSPKSVVARLFAMIWILIGITVFSMYTATLASSLTTALDNSQDVTLYKKKVAVMNTSAVGSIAAMKENVKTVGFEKLDKITEAYDNHIVDGIGLDEYMSNYFMEMLSQADRPVSLYYRRPIRGSSYGLIAYNSTVAWFFNSFFKSNDDQRDMMVQYTLSGHQHENIMLDEVLKTEGNPFFSHSSPLFLYSILGLFAISACATCIGLMLKWVYKTVDFSWCKMKAGRSKKKNGGMRGENLEMTMHEVVSLHDLKSMLDDINARLVCLPQNRTF